MNRFCVPVNKYDDNFSFCVNYVSSIHSPENNTLLLVNAKNLYKIDILNSVKNCLVFAPKISNISDELKEKHVFVLCDNPRLEYCKFFFYNKVDRNSEKYNDINKKRSSFYISPRAKIGKNVKISSCVYIGDEAVIGDNATIGLGSIIIGNVNCGNGVYIGENVILGTIGAGFERDSDGRIFAFPQLGGISIGDNTFIGSGVMIARGEIANTIIGKNNYIDIGTIIGHNCDVGDNCFIGAKTTVLGHAIIENYAFIASNVCIKNRVVIKEKGFVGLGSVVIKDVQKKVFGVPAKEIMF
jgi:UDP-3-O-[3-hydroxymyristoyl] glucosamine N-acyltransferase